MKNEKKAVETTAVVAPTGATLSDSAKIFVPATIGLVVGGFLPIKGMTTLDKAYNAGILAAAGLIGGVAIHYGVKFGKWVFTPKQEAKATPLAVVNH